MAFCGNWHILQNTPGWESLYTVLSECFVFPMGEKCTLVISFLVASVDECIQLFSPGRSAEFKDVLIDTTGAGLGILFVAVLTGIWNRFVLSR